jgi:Integrase core domain
MSRSSRRPAGVSPAGVDPGGDVGGVEAQEVAPLDVGIRRSWTRRRTGRHPPRPSTSFYSRPDTTALRRLLEPKQYLAIRYTERLGAAGAVSSVGSVGDSSYDNALAESVIGLYKTELVRRQGPSRGLDDFELATLEWVDWWNHRRLHSDSGMTPPAETEAAYYRQTIPTEPAGTQLLPPPRNPGRFNQSTLTSVADVLNSHTAEGAAASKV